MIFDVLHFCIIVTMGTQVLFALSERRYKLIGAVILASFCLDVVLALAMVRPMPLFMDQLVRTSISVVVAVAVIYVFYRIICKIFRLEGQSLYPRRKKD